jgi:hypothetical protein
MDGEDLELFERSIQHATESHTGAELDAALTELGWHDAFVVDHRAAIAILFRLQGASDVTSSAIDHVVTSGLGAELDASTGIALPAMNRWEPPGTVDGDGLCVRGLATASLSDRESTLVVAISGDELVSVHVPTSSLSLRRVGGIDPGLELFDVTGDGIDPSDATTLPSDAWTSAVALGRLAISHELIGTSRTMLALAREHALERIQFDRPIGSFQAIRHRLAETLVAIEMADALIDGAWIDGSPTTAAMAKALTGRNARTVIRHCQQVLAGIGFTTEHALHLYIRRTLVLDGLFGSALSVTMDLGNNLVSSRRLPPLLPL